MRAVFKRRQIIAVSADKLMKQLDAPRSILRQAHTQFIKTKIRHNHALVSQDADMR